MSKQTIKDKIQGVDCTLNLIRLLLQNKKYQLVIVVEGATDIKLYKKFFNNAEIVDAGGCKYINKIVSSINRTNVIGIRDSDFLKILGTSVDNKVFLTDYHDLEIMVLDEEDVITSLDAEHNIAINLDDICNELKDLILLKFYNIKNNKKICFKRLANSDYLLSLPSLILKLGVDGSDTNKDVMQNIFIFEEYDIKHLANGHDVCAVIGQKCKQKDLTIEQNIRLSYNLVHFKKTNLYEQLENYFNNNGLSNILKS